MSQQEVLRQPAYLRYIVPICLSVLAVIAISLGVHWSLMRDVEANARHASPYQGVFLTNGQVYFGKITEEHTKSLVLTEIFYFQQGSKDAAVPASPDLTLVKLGNEMHGPMDRMEINRDHVLFIEDLKDGGKVVQAMKAYQPGK